jgi:threonine/homoserine/homoserine lactone efflux protein
MPAIVISALTGFISGLLLAIPVGPVNLTIMNEGARAGFRQALMVSAGALVMETIYCALAFTGFANLFAGRNTQAFMNIFSFAFILFLGLKYLLAKSAPRLSTNGSPLEKKFHPTSGFMTGLVRVMGNVGVLLFWIFLSFHFLSRGWVTPDWSGKGACVAGVTAGTGAWFYGLSYAASLGHRKFSDATLLRIERGSGIGLLLLAAAHGCEMVWKLFKYHHL